MGKGGRMKGGAGEKKKPSIPLVGCLFRLPEGKKKERKVLKEPRAYHPHRTRMEGLPQREKERHKEKKKERHAERHREGSVLLHKKGRGGPQKARKGAAVSRWTSRGLCTREKKKREGVRTKRKNQGKVAYFGGPGKRDELVL